MDGYKKSKNNIWRGQHYSDTRYAVIKWLEKELPHVSGEVLNLCAGNWQVPKQMLNFKNIIRYVTFDQKTYSESTNDVNVIGNAHNLPFHNNEFDCVICNQSLECLENPFRVLDEVYRILKNHGVFLCDTPYNVSWFGYGSTPESLKTKYKVNDFWRITPQGMHLLCKRFKDVIIETSGPNTWDPYCVMTKAIKE